MTYGTQQNIWAIYVFANIGVELLLITWLTIGIVKKNSFQIKSSIKFLINSASSFIFSLYPFVYFGIWVSGPHGQNKQDLLTLLSDDILQSVTKWYLWAFLWLSLLLIFNIFYQTKIERRRSLKQVVFIFLVDLFIMSFGILYSAYCTHQALANEINGQTH